ncbi:thiolase family protein [Aliamphritea ceti]|uniref:thiolase family protein n=1 Tax=Aliamphritea ceti TaxID=1524258 RepID=UPI0021C31463|nr:thiolase family protein [Aliamphritea ceti]
MEQAVIAGYCRSPFDFAHKGALAGVRPDTLAAKVIRGLVRNSGINPTQIEDLLCGCAFPEGEQGLNMARMLVFLSRLPDCIPGATVNRWCGSSMQSIHMAAGSIAMGAGDAFICAGVESMSRIPMMGYNPLPNQKLYKENARIYMSMGETAEVVAEHYNISREAQETFAISSQQKALQAQQQGLLTEEIIPLEELQQDGCIRGESSAEGLATLNPAFVSDGSVTAGTSSPLTDGAAAVLVCSESYARRHNLPMLAHIKTVAVAGCAPEVMGMGPVAASKKALQRAGLNSSELDVIELNEAFASQALACIRELELDPEKVNQHGGAIALGHPLGASGARIVGKAASLLHQSGGKHALATQCIGGGQGIATLLEAI